MSKTFIALCYNNDAEINDLPINETFQQTHHEFIHQHNMYFRLMDCDTVLPNSGKIISKRFNLDTDKDRVILFMSGNTGLSVQSIIKTVNIWFSISKPRKHLKYTKSRLVRTLKQSVWVRTCIVWYWNPGLWTRILVLWCLPIWKRGRL